MLTVAMECAYAPYNWTQPDDSNGAVPIRDTNEYANGYDVMMAKKMCEANGWELEIVRLDWDSLMPAVQSGAGGRGHRRSVHDRRPRRDGGLRRPVSATPRIVCLAKQDTPQAEAKGISELQRLLHRADGHHLV